MLTTVTQVEVLDIRFPTSAGRPGFDAMHPDPGCALVRDEIWPGRKLMRPHAGGVGLCEYVQHLAVLDYIAVSGTLENRVVEYVDHLHEHFLDPVVVERGRYRVPSAPGYSIAMKPESFRTHAYPHGSAWCAS